VRVIGVIQARISSRRLPGKILLELLGRPSLDYLVEALRHARGLDALVLGTSTEPGDDATAAFAASRGLPCYRGSLDDVALRLLRAGEMHGADAIARINGDSPLLDPRVVDEAVELFRSGGADVVTNVRPRSFPKGQSVEVIALEALRRAVARMTTSHEREHVTPHFYARPDEYRIRSFVTADARPDVQLCIDDAADLDRCAAILQALAVPHWQAGWRACVQAYDACLASDPVRAGRT
jgi:spore coat polysaccharide biosynthesis protein SpsF